MKMEFSDISSYFFRNWDSRGNNIYCFSVLDKYFSRSEESTTKARNTLELAFSSLIFESDSYEDSNGKYNTFYFSDSGEEAQFILCFLKNGLEI